MTLLPQSISWSLVAPALVAVLATTLMVKLLRWLVDYKTYFTLVNSLPGETEFSWLWGNVATYRKMTHEERMQYLFDMTARHPKFFRVWYGPFRAVVQLNHPDTLREIVKQAGPKSFSYDFIKPWLGEGLLVAHGDRWGRSRRLLTPAFHFDILRPYNVISNRACDLLLAKIARAASENESLDMYNPVSLCTLDVIMQCAMGYIDDIQTKGENHPYVQAVKAMADLAGERIRNPLVYRDWVYSCTANGRKFRQLCDFVHSVSDKVIQARKESLAKVLPDNKRHLDFLDVLLTAKDEKGQGMTPLEIRNEVDTFLFEGHDTTASSVSWTLYSLCLHPEWQHKIQAEVDEILQGRETDDIEWDDLSRLPTTTMCIKEAMRLHCPVPFVSRRLAQPLTVEGATIPAGTVCTIAMLNLHRNPAVWPDPLTFRPERFHPDQVKGRDSYAFIPFSAGPRNCIGQHFAMNEQKVMIGKLLRRFTFALDPSTKVEHHMAMVMRTEKGMRMFATPRTPRNLKNI